ncbi:MAG: putative RNA helicase [Chaenotheca gracillima]|nr:MAG: putative RNA helicase [Chaenotheca gracillima]
MAGKLFMNLIYLAALVGASPVPEAAPQAPGTPLTPGNVCENEQIDYTLTDGFPNRYWGPWTLATGVNCDASIGGCTVGKNYAVTKSVTYSVGASLGLAFEKIFSLAPSIDASVSFSTSDSTGTTVGVNCPNTYVCGLSYTIKYAEWDGDEIRKNGKGTCPAEGTKHYHFTTPESIGDDPNGSNGGTSLHVQFSACITAESRNQTVIPNLGACPGGDDKSGPGGGI